MVGEMWRNFLFAAALLAASGAGAQESLETALGKMSVFDCTAGGERAVYVFRSDELGNVSLVNDLGIEVQAENGAYSIETPQGARRIAPDGYFLVRDGAEIRGVCVSVTDPARATYPVITAGLLPQADQDTSAETLAMLVSLDDLEGQVAELTAANAVLRETLAEVTQTLAATEQDRDAAQAEVAALAAKLAAMENELALERQALSDEAAVSDALHATLTVARQELETTELARRASVAMNAALGTQVNSLEQAVQSARAATAKAEHEADAARDATGKMRKLADAAIAWISTRQVRSPDAVRAEMCRSLSASARPDLCG